MRFDRDLLIFKALCALDEYADQCRGAPIKPTFGLRFALAFLYSQSNGDSTSFTSFWDQVQGKRDAVETQREYIRFTMANTYINGIINAVRWKCPGVPHKLIGEARRTGHADKVFREAREREAKIVAEWEAQGQKVRDMRRKSKDCGYL